MIDTNLLLSICPPSEWLAIANLLPPEVDAREWHGQDTAKFEQFLDELGATPEFPREKFLKFRQAVYGENLIAIIARKLHLRIVPQPRSPVDNYQCIVSTSRMWRSSAEIGRRVALSANKRLPPLRFCAFCRRLFIAGRNNKKTCDKKCGAALRQRRKRVLAKEGEYELRRELRISRKNDRQRRLKKGASR